MAQTERVPNFVGGDLDDELAHQLFFHRRR